VVQVIRLIKWMLYANSMTFVVEDTVIVVIAIKRFYNGFDH
jgi:hypothetical protein